MIKSYNQQVLENENYKGDIAFAVKALNDNPAITNIDLTDTIIKHNRPLVHKGFICACIVEIAREIVAGNNYPIQFSLFDLSEAVRQP